MQLSRYLLTGGTAAAVDIGGFALFSAIHVPMILAAASSFLLATVMNFLLTARWVFGAQASLPGYMLFLSGAMLGAFTNITVTTVAITSLHLQRIFAKAIAVAATFVLNFWINALVVFRARVR